MPVRSAPPQASCPRVAVACRCILGEEAAWDARSGTLTWVDVEAPAIWRFHPESGTVQTFPQAETLGFALPTDEPDAVVAGFRSGVARLDLRTGRRVPLVTPPGHGEQDRLNSGQIGPDGALYFGTMDGAESEPRGAFHRWQAGRLQTFGGPVVVSNGPTLTPDGARLYAADTVSGVIRIHDVLDGIVGAARPFVAFEPGWGKPDGLTVDADGYLWVCHYGGGRISRFDPEGRVERVIPMPTPLITKCAFGGPDMTRLFVTTGSRDRTSEEDALAGHLFTIETDVVGVPATPYRDTGRL